jgi:hypothetical protein
MAKQSNKARILGLGLDNQDGHVRVTRAENFHLVGGSQETHEGMQEQAVKFNEKLKDRGKTLESLERRELRDLAADVGMHVVEIRKKDDPS